MHALTLTNDVLSIRYVVVLYSRVCQTWVLCSVDWVPFSQYIMLLSTIVLGSIIVCLL